MMELRMVANSPLPAEQRCDDDWFAKCMKSLDILPKRQDDALGGQLKFGLYKRHLGGFSNDALSYLTMQATKTCHWFPTIAECLDLLKAWPNRSRDVERQEKAAHLIRRELNIRMDEAVAAMARRELGQDEIDALPDLTKRVAAEKGYLWKWPDGRFTVRLDLDRLDEEAREAERAKIRAMFTEWERIAAADDADDGQFEAREAYIERLGNDVDLDREVDA